ncbi:hypothetical protein FX983_01352 [Pseudomonas frederiksbergensis]|uniref:Uncharacterized protein n=1 Tax=Pseudomonas frederiksbergensis TaxID=104087 RepID=A0A6L5C1H3_9PSED|nr:hypothetical protein FX983_01352 [Pseudomonas frederiksbergensis]
MCDTKEMRYTALRFFMVDLNPLWERACSRRRQISQQLC